MHPSVTRSTLGVLDGDMWPAAIMSGLLGRTCQDGPENMTTQESSWAFLDFLNADGVQLVL